MKRRLLCLVFICVFACLIPTVSLTAFAESDVTTNGAECFFEHADSGIVICGDSRCCQIHNYKQDYGFASFGCVWGGNYYTTDATNVIASPAHVKAVQGYIKNTVAKKGSCVVFCFATINGWGAKGNRDVKNIDGSIQLLTDFAEQLKADKTKIYLVSLVGQLDLDTNTISDVSEYNKKLKEKASSFDGYVDIVDLIKPDSYLKYGSTVDNLHYGDEALKSIRDKISEVANTGNTGDSNSNNASNGDAPTGSGVVISGQFMEESEFASVTALVDGGSNFPSFSDMGIKDQMSTKEWLEDVRARTAADELLLLRRILVFVGILVVVYSSFLYVAYQFDVNNNFIELQLLNVLTLGKLAVSPDEQSTYTATTGAKTKGVVHKDIICICLVGISLGILILSGKLYWILNVIIQFIRAKLSM